MTVFVCSVPATRDVLPPADVLIRQLSDQWPSLPDICDIQEHDRTLSFSFGIASVILGRMSSEIVASDLQGPRLAASLWPNADHDLQEHLAHTIVTVSGESDRVALATLLTQVTASLLSVNTYAMGVFWTGAAKLIHRDVFLDQATQVMPQGPPVHLWVECRVARPDLQSSAAFTTGMSALGHLELEVTQSPEAPADLMNRLLSLAGYLIEHGPVLSDGDTIGQDESERICIVHSDSAFGHPGRVMRLVYEA